MTYVWHLNHTCCIVNVQYHHDPSQNLIYCTYSYNLYSSGCNFYMYILFMSVPTFSDAHFVRPGVDYLLAVECILYHRFIEDSIRNY